MDPIRTGPAPAQTRIDPPAADARTAAQRAFFDAALGRTTSSPAAVPVAETARSLSQPAVQRTAAAAAADPQRPLRPGSLLDIRV